MEKILIKDLSNYLESIAPLALQENFDNSGLLVGTSDTEIKGVLISLDITEEIIEEAIASNCNVIVAHHPIVFSGIKKLNGKNYVERCVIKAIRNDVALYAIHTNLDHVMGGVNAKLAEKLGLQNCRILAPKKGLVTKLITFCPIEHLEKVRSALFEAGAGAIGEYDECSFTSEGRGTFRASETANPFVGKPHERHTEAEVRLEMVLPVYAEKQVISALLKAHPYEEVAYDLLSLANTNRYIGGGMIGELPKETTEMEVLSSVKATFEVGCVRYTKLLNRRVKKIAVCGGSGSFLLNDAIAAGADMFITSDYKYHQFFDAENRIVIADIGHYESEQFTKELLFDLIRKKFSTFALRLTKINSNPINYL